MAEASILSLKPKSIDINKYHELDNVWYSLGTELEIEDEELDKLEEKYSDPHERLLKIFGVWLEKGKYPTYRKIVQALMDIDKKDIAQSICTRLGLTSSLDSLLNTTSHTKLSECGPKETDSNIDTRKPISDHFPQKTTASEHEQNLMKSASTSCADDQPIPLLDSSHREKVKDDSANMYDTSDYSEVNGEASLTVSSPHESIAHDAILQARSSSDTNDQTLTLLDSSYQEHSSEGQTVVTSGHQTASIYISAVSTTPNNPHQNLMMLHCNDELVTALSLDPHGIAEVLQAKGLIPENTETQMQQCSTLQEKATILVTTVRQRIEIAPEQFQEFLDIRSKQEWSKEIMEVLQLCINLKQSRKDVSVQAVPTSGNGSTDKERKSSAEISSNGEEHIFPKLNSEYKAEFEAQLILNADRIRKKFASLVVNVISSFQNQGIDPQQVVTTILALTEYDDPALGKPLLKREEQALKKVQSIDDTFDILRPHMTFFNYEVLEFLVEQMGSPIDKDNLQKFLQEFRRFCKQHIFEIPPNVLGHSAEKVIDQQKICINIKTKQFKAALFVQCMKQSEPNSQTASSTQLSSSQENRERICAPELGISLDDVKYIQRKLASVLKLKVSTVYLDSVSSGNTILTFLLPSHISLTGVDSDPEVIALSSNGIYILCGPPGKPEPKELTSEGVVVEWSQPDYGRSSLAKYTVYYRKICSDFNISLNEWWKLELGSLKTHTCVPDLSNGDRYIFKICTVSDVGTLQYSHESDPIVISAVGILTNNIHKVIVANKDTLISAFSSADPNTITIMLLINGVISKEDEAQISLASTPSDKATLLVTAIENQVKCSPEKFQKFLNAISEAKLLLPGDIVEKFWSEYYDRVYKQYLDYLKFLYTSLDKKQTSSNQWPPSATKKFFRLAMINTTEVETKN